MAYVIARLIAIPTVAIGSAWLVTRYRVVGVVISVFAGWAILFAAYRGFPVPPGEWDEDGEDIHVIAPILMLVWSLIVYCVVTLWSFVTRRGNRHGEV